MLELEQIMGKGFCQVQNPLVGLGMIFSLAMPENQDWDTINELTEHCEI
jgi:hypothetical protein